jgi:NADH-quinone oxidoreductase subunit H
MPVAESEIISGYQVEYSGFRFLLFFLAEFATAFAFAAVAAVLFLGGWAVPWMSPDNDWYYVLGPVILFVKIMAVSFIIFWVRFTYPRFREDQLQSIAWKFLIPLALVNIMVTAVFKVAF